MVCKDLAILWHSTMHILLFSEKFHRFLTQNKGELIQNCFRHEKIGWT
jgi:hypothetical protein